jgi:hypothetical protein
MQRNAEEENVCPQLELIPENKENELAIFACG